MRRRSSIRSTYPQSLPLHITGKVVKYFLLSLVGCTLAYFVSVILELGFLTTAVVIFLENVLTRVFALLFCLIPGAVIAESLKH